MNLSQLRYIYFVGIGGIGMSALARWFHLHQYQVAGYDRQETPLTRQLQQEGIAIHYDENLDKLPAPFLSDDPKTRESCLVVYTPAVPASHLELSFFRQQQFLILKRAAVLGMLTRDFPTIAVAGTHGKTTTSSMIAHILHNARLNPTAFLGGILQNYDSNLILGELSEEKAPMVVEADEYDKSFLHLQPQMAVITSMDADHLDIYGNKSHLRETFVEFSKKIRMNGSLFIKKGLDLKHDIGNEPISINEYALNEPADYRGDNIQIRENAFEFDFHGKKAALKSLKLYMPGFHNVENAVVALAVCESLGVSDEDLHLALQSYRGVKRRFEYIIREGGKVFIDDYAHHPEEIRALLNSVRALYNGKRISVIFQPHLYSRTRDFVDGFAESLSLADELMLMEIYPAREKAIPGVDSKLILDKVSIKDKLIYSREEILEKITKQAPEVLLSVGAGDIADLVNPIKQVLLNH